MLKDTEKKLHDRGKKVEISQRQYISQAHLDNCCVIRDLSRLHRNSNLINERNVQVSDIRVYSSRVNVVEVRELVD